MINILHWTEGQGTGHIKRINAMLRCYQQNENLRYWVQAEDPKFVHLLPENAHQWNGEEPKEFDLLVLDLEDPLQDLSILCKARKFLQLCRLGSPLELPDQIRDDCVQLSFENCRMNRDLKMPYFGCLLDANKDHVLGLQEARRALQMHTGIEMQGHLGLSHANSADKDAAFTFLKESGIELLKKNDFVVLASGHHAIAKELEIYFKCSPLFVCNINPIYSYYPAFNQLIAPTGYNTYHEAHLFFQGELKFKPMYPPDQRLRFEEKPVVDRQANQAIFEFICQYAGLDLNSELTNICVNEEQQTATTNINI